MLQINWTWKSSCKVKYNQCESANLKTIDLSFEVEITEAKVCECSNSKIKQRIINIKNLPKTNRNSNCKIRIFVETTCCSNKLTKYWKIVKNQIQPGRCKFEDNRLFLIWVQALHQSILKNLLCNYKSKKYMNVLTTR